MRKANAKDRLLETAGQLFHERGYSEVGINEIIKKAETAKASFYQHFNSKEALCEAWLETIHDRSEISRDDILKSDEDPIKKVKVYFNGLETYLVNSNFRGCPFSNTASVMGECCGILSKIEEHKECVRAFFQTLATEIASSNKRGREIGDQLFILYSGGAGEAQNVRAIWPIQAARQAALEICNNERNE